MLFIVYEVPRTSANIRFEDNTAVAVCRTEALQSGQRGGEFRRQGVGRIDEEKSAAVHAVIVTGRADMQFSAQIIVREARAQGGGETAAFGAGEAGIPDEIAAIGEALVRDGEGIENGLVVAFLFVGRVDEDDGATAWWRQAGDEAGKAVTLCDMQAAAETEWTQVILQGLVIGGMQFVEM